MRNTGKQSTQHEFWPISLLLAERLKFTVCFADYVFNMADLNPSQKLIAQALSSRYFCLPTPLLIFIRTHRRGLRCTLESSGCVWEAHGQGHEKQIWPEEQGTPEGTQPKKQGSYMGPTWPSQENTHRSEREARVLKSLCLKSVTPCLSPLKHTSIRFGDLRR